MTGPAAGRGERRYVYRSAWKRAAAAAGDALGGAAVRLVTLGRGLRPVPGALDAPERILVVRLDHLGDVLFARPCLEALKRRFPGASLTLLASPAACELLAGDANLDILLPWAAPWFAREPSPGRKAGIRRLIRELRRRRFDLSLELRGDARHHLLLWLAGVRVRIGFTATGGGFLLHRPLRLPAGRHEVERNLLAAAAAGAVEFPAGFSSLPLSDEEARRGDGRWPGRGPRVVLHPGAGDPDKRWPAARFAAVCDALAGRGCQTALVGVAAEAPLADEICARCRRPPLDWTGATTARELAALIRAADLVIGNDSGPAHLAVTEGRPVIMLWSETNAPEEWGPWGEGARAAVVRRPARPEATEEILAAAARWLPGRD